MKRRDHTRKSAPAEAAPLDARFEFNPIEWASLRDAVARIRKAVGSRDFAEHDLRSGRLRSAVWRLANGGKGTFQHLKPSFWEGRTLIEVGEDGFALRPDNQLDRFRPLLPYKIDRMNGREVRESGLWLKAKDRQERSFLGRKGLV